MKQKKLLTQKVRLKLWRQVRRRIKEYLDTEEYEITYNGICTFLFTAIDRQLHKNLACPSLLEQEYFPELWKRRPLGVNEDHNGYWWPEDKREGFEKRLEVVNEIIKELEYKR